MVMPSRRHETPAAWVIGEFAHWTAAGTLSSEMGDLIDIFPSPSTWCSHLISCYGLLTTITAVEGFVGVYAGSTKEPDLAIWPTGLPFPTFVLESGWSETWSDLTADKILWSEGSGYKVNTVILIKMMRPVANRVKVKMEVSTYGQGRHIATMSQVSLSFRICSTEYSNLRGIVPIPAFYQPPAQLHHHPSTAVRQCIASGCTTWSNCRIRHRPAAGEDRTVIASRRI